MSSPEENRPRAVRFDEEVIKEHDKDRGTRTKIDEPKTPYVNAPDTLDDLKNTSFKPVNIEELRARLLADQTSNKPQQVGTAKDKAAAFNKQRKQHYNEFHQIQKLRSQGGLLDDDE